ncbi:MAG: transglycosylase SLT domain-containing protein, partial [Myxococcota bacterium]
MLHHGGGMARLTAILMGVLLSVAPARAAEAHPFEMPESLTPAVGFWVRVYAEWHTYQVAIHDSAHPDVIYRVLDLSEFAPRPSDDWPLKNEKADRYTEQVKAAREEIAEALRELDVTRPESARGLGGLQREVFLAWEHRSDDPERFGAAAGRVRSQRGLQDRFANGWRQGGRFLGAIQQALREAGMPEGLVAMAFTESLLDVHARSASGAVGPWQFLSGTGREYLVINDVVDERKDPVLATMAAARYLSAAKGRLGSWGLTVTSYNYGANGMARARAQLGTTDIERVLREYQTRSFGFAAKNYYAEFLASLHVITHADHYFPNTRPLPPWTFDAVALPTSATVRDLLDQGITRDRLAELNPALTPNALAGKVRLPRGLTVRVPVGKGAAVVQALKARGEADPPAVASKKVKLRRGETLLAVARRHKVSLGDLCALNGLNPNDSVHAGLELSVPAPRAGFTPLPEARAATQHGTPVAVTFAAPASLAPHAPLLAARRPAPEPVWIAFDASSSGSTPVAL